MATDAGSERDDRKTPHAGRRVPRRRHTLSSQLPDPVHESPADGEGHSGLPPAGEVEFYAGIGVVTNEGCWSVILRTAAVPRGYPCRQAIT
jgi:hypothetical protein